MDRWWDAPDPSARLALVDGSDPGMGVSVAVLGFHAIAKSALSELETQTLVDRGQLEGAFDAVDLGPVRKAVAAATSGTLGPVAADRYADLVVDDLRARGKQAAGRLTATLVAKGLPWPKAVARASGVAGVPLERLGRYATIAATPGLDALSAADAADRVLMDYAAARGALEYRSGGVAVAKASQERSRTAEEAPWDENSVRRDALGQFATESSQAASQAAKDRIAARRKRKARKAKRAAREARPAQEAAAAGQASAGGRKQAQLQRVVKPMERKQQSLKRTPLKMSRTQKQLFRAQVKELTDKEILEGSLEREEVDEDVAGPPFGLPHKKLRYVDVDDPPKGAFTVSPALTFSRPTEDGGQPLQFEHEIVSILGPDPGDITNWKARRIWTRGAARAGGVDIDEGPFDPDTMTWVMQPTDQKIDEGDEVYELPSGATPAHVLESGHMVVTAGNGEFPGVEYLLHDEPLRDRKVRAFTGELEDPDTGDFINYRVLWPVTQIELTDLNAGRRYGIFSKASAERSAEHEQWDESQVRRDELGQFASESDQASAERKERIARRKRRKTRKARRAQLRERNRAELAAQAEKTKDHPAGKGRDQQQLKREQKKLNRVNTALSRKQVALDRPQKMLVRAQSIPPGLPSFSRKEAPDEGLFTLTEPLYAMKEPKADEPITVLTEQAVLSNLRRMVVAPPRSTGSGDDMHYLEPAQKPDLPTVYRFEAGTIPLSGRRDVDEFTVASPDALGRPWTTSYAPEGEMFSTGEFYVAAPGKVGQRDVETRHVTFVNLITDFTGVDKRSRERSAEQEPWDESKIHRDSLGQFAASETEAAKKARKQRRARRARRANRREQQASAARAREQRSSNRQQTSLNRTQIKSKRVQQAMNRVQVRSKREQLALHRTQTALARKETVANPGVTTVEELRADPENSSLGQWLGSAGRFPTPLILDNRAFPASAAAELAHGNQVPLSDVIEELAGHDDIDKAHSMLQLFSGVQAGLAARSTPKVKDFAIDRMTQMLGSHAGAWGATDSWISGVHTAPYDDELDAHESYGVTRGDDGELVGLYNDNPDSGQQKRRMMAGRSATVVLARMEALAKLATSEDELDETTQQLAQDGWDSVMVNLDEPEEERIDVGDLDHIQLMRVIRTIASQSNLIIEPLHSKAWVEAIKLSLNNRDGQPIRLDDKGFYKITSSQDTHNGWAKTAKEKERT